MLKAAAEQLPAEQTARYQAETTERYEFRKQVVIQNLLAQYDDFLKLSAKQRGEVGDKLAEFWDDGWDSALDGLNNPNQYLPSIHLNCLLPFLDGRQKALWRETYAVSGSFWWAAGFSNTIVVDDKFPMEEELGKPEVRVGAGVLNKVVAP